MAADRLTQVDLTFADRFAVAPCRLTQLFRGRIDGRDMAGQPSQDFDGHAGAKADFQYPVVGPDAQQIDRPVAWRRLVRAMIRPPSRPSRPCGRPNIRSRIARAMPIGQ
jgi:hypothetical protein